MNKNLCSLLACTLVRIKFSRILLSGIEVLWSFGSTISSLAVLKWNTFFLSKKFHKLPLIIPFLAVLL